MATRRETSCGSNDFTSEAEETFNVRVTEEENPLLQRRGFAEGHRAKIEPGCRDITRMHGLPQEAVYFYRIKLNRIKAFVANARPEDAITLRTRILVPC